jgi:hypothetical protein
MIELILHFQRLITYILSGCQSRKRATPIRPTPWLRVVLVLFFGLSFGQASSDPLQGQVEEETIEPAKPSPSAPVEPLAVPVLKAPEPNLESQTGQADNQQSSLKGQAETDTSAGKADWVEDGLKPESAKAAGAPAKDLLKGSAELEDGAALTGQDPDMDDQELQVEWDRWRNRFLRAVLSGATESMNNPQEANFHWDPLRHALVSPFPLGLESFFACTISNDRRITNLKLVRPSGNGAFDQAVLDSVRALEGTSILRFPDRSRRKFVSQAGGVRTSDHAENRYYHFGDVEHYRIPAN